jgi:hypothetical protein
VSATPGADQFPDGVIRPERGHTLPTTPFGARVAQIRALYEWRVIRPEPVTSPVPTFRQSERNAELIIGSAVTSASLLLYLSLKRSVAAMDQRRLGVRRDRP